MTEQVSEYRDKKEKGNETCVNEGGDQSKTLSDYVRCMGLFELPDLLNVKH